MSIPETRFLEEAKASTAWMQNQPEGSETNMKIYFYEWKDWTPSDKDGYNVAYPDGKHAVWSDKDLRYMIDNFPMFKNWWNRSGYRRNPIPGAFFRYKKANTNLGGTEIGFIEYLKNTKNKSNKLLTEFMLLCFGQLRGNPGDLGQNKHVPDYFIENEDQILKIIALQRHNFKSFDLEITEEVNKYLDTDPPVVGLVFAGKTIAGGDYYWPEQGKEVIPTKNTEGLVDNTLYDRKNEFVIPGGRRPDGSFYMASLSSNIKYKKPFQGSQFLINDARLAEDRGFSNFEISKLKGVSGLNRISFGNSKVAWVIFIGKLFGYIESTKNSSGQYTYNLGQADELQKTQIDNYLNTEYSVEVPRAAQFTYDKVKMTAKNAVAKSILDVLRYGAWKNYHKDLGKDLTDEEFKKYDTFGALKNAFEAGSEAAKNSEAALGGEPTEGETLSQKEIEARQKFLKQCALMTRLPQLQREHEQTLKDKKKKVHAHGAYNKRFYMVKDGDVDQSGIMTKLLLPKGKSIKEFLNITPAAHAHLTPKLRFFKVFDGSTGVEQQEFKFRNFTSRSRVDNLSSRTFDKGGDYGIKEFSFSFEGTTPATAKNDIKANLSLYFQSFQDFIDKGFVDMLLLPGGKNAAEPQESKFAYSPRYYRLRVDVGWNIDSLNVDTLKAKLGNARLGQLQNALIKTNKSFYLNMVDHTLDFKDDGSVQIDVEYRAYIESSTKGSKLDALASPDILEMRDKIRKDYNKVLNANKCNLKELSMIKGQLDQISDLMVKQSFQSIMNRLIDNECMYFKKFRESSDDQFQRRGFFTSKVKFANEKTEPTTKKTKAEKATKDETLKITADSFDEDLSNDKDYLYANYFYLGDLLYVILDSLYSSANGNGNYRSGYEKFKFILGSFQYEDIFTGENHVINLAQIPISCELFFEWFTENVLKPERRSYPITYFIRDLCKYLIGEILSESCFRKSLDKTMQFQTTNFVGIGNPFDKLKGNIKDINKTYSKKNSVFPLAQDSAKGFSVGDLTNYIMIYVNAPKLQIKKSDPDYKRGKKSSDEDIGIYHYQIGKPHGLLKKLKFAKTDMQYIREARFMRSGFDGLLQLAAVYKVTLEMVGNTLYYPGMEVFVNPLGFMGASNSNYNPTKIGTVANKLGFGGYHLVTSVRSTIAPGKFTTQVEAMFNYSGDGDPASTVVGSRDSTKKKKAITDKTESFKAGGYCATVYNQVINRALAVDDGAQYTPLDEKLAVVSSNDSTVEEIDAVTGVLPTSASKTEEEKVKEVEKIIEDLTPSTTLVDITEGDTDLGDNSYMEADTGRFYRLSVDGKSKQYEE